MRPARVILEIAVGTLDDALAAQAGGADRIELNVAMPLGGLTPSLGLLREVKRRVRLPVMAMVRPRPGGCFYSPADFDVLCRDVEAVLAEGADGVVFGILQPSGEIDVDRCRKVLKIVNDRVPAVFHRAFDLTPDPFAALEQLIDLGFRRVMTSGQEASAYDGIWRIASLLDEADGRIEILPAGGINRHNIADIVTRTCCDQIHCGLRKTFIDPSATKHPHVRFTSAPRFVESEYEGTDEAAVAHLRSMLNDAAG